MIFHLTLFHDSHFLYGIRRIFQTVINVNHVNNNSSVQKIVVESIQRFCDEKTLFYQRIILLQHYVIKIGYRQAHYGTV
jgi:hypothetical protein